MLEHIEVSSADGRHRRILLHENLTNPWAIAVDPRPGVRFLFFTDWAKNPRIERCSMDGQERITLVNDSIHMPFGLTLDLIREKVYFSDRHLNYIEVISYTGADRRKILSNTHFLHAPTSIAIFENYLYWFDSNSNEVRRLNRFEHDVKAQRHERILSRTGITHLKISHQIYQPSGTHELLLIHVDFHFCVNLRFKPMSTISLYTTLSSFSYCTIGPYLCLFNWLLS